jgi:hypothetical protein
MNMARRTEGNSAPDESLCVHRKPGACIERKPQGFSSAADCFPRKRHEAAACKRSEWMLTNLLRTLRERFYQQHHQGSVQLHFGKPYTVPVFAKDIKYLHPPSIRA